MRRLLSLVFFSLILVGVVNAEVLSEVETVAASYGNYYPADVIVEDIGDSIRWTFDMVGTKDLVGGGHWGYGVIISFDGVHPAFQVHNNDGSDSAYSWGTHLYSEWGPEGTGYNGWHTGTGGNNIPITDVEGVTATGGRDIIYDGGGNPINGIFTITISKEFLGVGKIYWAVYTGVGGFYSPNNGYSKWPEAWAEWSGDSSTLVEETFSMCVVPNPADDNVIDVPTECLTIQSAIDAASDGNTINVAAGTYVGDLTINKANLELVGADKTTTTIKGVQSDVWPVHMPAISVTASGVNIHGFTIETPDLANGKYSEAVTIGATNVEIYDNIFSATDNGTGTGWSALLVTYGNWSGDVSGLYIHDNIFTSDTGTDKGSEGIYINYNSNNPTPTGTVTIEDNVFEGQLFRGITSERSKTTITGNTISSSYSPASAFNSALRGIDISSNPLNPTQDTVLITDNTITGFWQGIRLGITGEAIANFVVTGNTLQSNDYGIKVYDSTNDVSEVIINYNEIIGSLTLGIQNVEPDGTLNAEYNWWGDCNGPYHPTTNPLANGDEVTDNVDYDPWLGICFENKPDINCAHEIKDAVISANLVSNFDWVDVWFVTDINGVLTNRTPGLNIDDYFEYTIHSSEFSGGEDVKWNVYAEDEFGNVFNNSWKEFYVRNKTELTVIPIDPDGDNVNRGYYWG